MGTGTCPRCGASDWGTRNRCNNCERLKARAARKTASAEWIARERARMAAWRKANPDRKMEQALRQRYGLSADDFKALLIRQDGRCPICQSSRVECVDHHHASGVVRGILCRPCNSALGQFQDDPELLIAAAAYLEASR